MNRVALGGAQMTSDVPHIGGMLLVDGRGSIVFGNGIFRDTTVRSAVVQKWKREGTETHQILALRAGGQELVVLSVPVEDGTLFVNISSGVDNPLFEFVATVPFAGDILEHLLTDPYEAMTVVDAD